ncbi:transglycosylase domain-containing protein [Amycolatopsis sp. OK19-0408]|uniref:Transglycosylase domain-containing protein n=1 Tax=Amycolatopsis iheyensis TaxID=2945988 RepID=A0A9X2NQJ0_9PSEU|nr:transglycosylase domain-containing protein [Amycolatopsis iheyensis]MCR6490650.1 transglycosylase domain-containing protein [Amycolatopsis iheyensis]
MRPGRFSRFLTLCVLAGVLVAGIAAPAALGAGLVSNQVSDSVDAVTADLASVAPPLATTVTDRDGKPIATLYEQYRLPVTARQIATTLKAAIIAVEDRGFYDEARWTPAPSCER